MPFLSEARPPRDARPLTVAEQQMLLQYAREAVIEAVCHGDLPRVLRNDGIFGERCGVFVTLHVHQHLRGCIGVVDSPREPVAKGGHDMAPPHAIDPLGSTLVRCAASAALGDPRFPPIRPNEIPDLRIEISLLSAPTHIRPEQIEIGRHGLLIVGAPPLEVQRESDSAPPFLSKDGLSIKRGLLLPQVAVEHHLTAEQFLAETCRKAGLSPDAWRLCAETGPSSAAGHGDSSSADACRVRLFAFTCQVFSAAEKPSPVDS
jgi:uncharacterized protein